MTGEPPTPLDPSFRIELPAFEGPLDLLLHLIQKHELEILDLPIAFVTEKYLAYIGLMQQLDLDIASEYLLMAATLAHIKSKMLLPTPPVGQDDDGLGLEELDPRQELIRRLLEYQKYKAAAEALGARDVMGRDVFVRGSELPEAQGPAPLAEITLFQLLDALQKVMTRAHMDLAREVTAERITIQERMTQILERLGGGRRAQFDELFEGARTTYEVIVTFLALLEMAKMKLARIYQAMPDTPIYLELAVTEATAEDLLRQTPITSDAPPPGEPAFVASGLREPDDDVADAEPETETETGAPADPKGPTDAEPDR